MSKVVESGMLRGRPFGGVAILIKNNLRTVTRSIHCCIRYAIVKVGSCLFVSVYLPCRGSTDRQLVCDDVLSETDAWLSQYRDCTVVFAGDLNVNLDSSDQVVDSVYKLISQHGLVVLVRCDELHPSRKRPTYVNVALKHESTIVYILTSSKNRVESFAVIDSGINFSDHLPLLAVIRFANTSTTRKKSNNSHSCKPAQFQLRWDQADLVSYYYYSGELLRPLVAELDDDLTVYYSSDDFDVVRCIDEYYCRIVNTLVSCANNFVPVRRKGFYKFWWDEGLDTLKEAAIESDRLWKSAGRPRFGPIFSERQRA